MRRTMLFTLACTALTLSAAFADGKQHKNQPFQLFEGPAIPVQPKRMMKVCWWNGRIVPVTPWITVGDFSPAGPCNPNETLVWDHFGADASGNPTGGNTCRDGFAPATRYYFGATYNNPYYANDIETLVNAQYNGGTASSLAHAWFWTAGGQGTSETCVILIRTVENLDTTCQSDVHDVFDNNPFIEGVVLDYGNLGSSVGVGYYASAVCLSGVGGIRLPSTPDSNGVLGGYVVIYASAFDPNTGQVTPATGAQPMLWSTQITGVGTSTSTQWDDDNPTNYNHTAPNECYDYTYNGLCPLLPNVTIWGGMMAFWVLPCTPNGGDVDGNGCVDDADLLRVLFAFGGQGGAEDTNCDGVVDDADLLEVLFNFGTGC